MVKKAGKLRRIASSIIIALLFLSLFVFARAHATNQRQQGATGNVTTGTSIRPWFVYTDEFSNPFSGYSPHASESLQEQGSYDTGFEALSATNYTAANYPQSISYQVYTSIGASRQFTVGTPTGPIAISLGVMNGSAAVQVSQGGQVLLRKSINGTFFNYVALTASNSYCYVNFDSSGQPLNVTFSRIAGEPSVAYNLYNNYISDYTASLITYPPQFALNLGPPSTPVNTGLSFLLVAPNYTQPTPLAIWLGEGFSNPNTGQSWWAQIGFNNWAADDMSVSYAGWGIFSNIFGSPGGTDTNYPLVPGDTYNFTMALISGTTWEFSVNGTAIQEGSLTGFFNTTSSVANEGADLGLETLTWWGGNVNITSMIRVPIIMSFLVDSKWSEPKNFAFGTVGENWWNGNATSSPGIDLWGIAGHLQDSSVPVGSLLFNDSLPMPLDIPGTESEPIYGNYSYPQASSGGGLVTVEKTSNTSLQVSPVSIPSFVSVATYEFGDNYMTSLTDAKVTASKNFTVPEGTDVAVIYAANSAFNKTSSSVMEMIPHHNAQAPAYTFSNLTSALNAEWRLAWVAETVTGANQSYLTVGGNGMTFYPGPSPQLPNILISGSGFLTGTAYDGKGFLLVGQRYSPHGGVTMYLYDPAANSLTNLTGLFSPSLNSNATLLETTWSGSVFYVLGLENENVNVSPILLFSYDPLSNVLTDLTPVLPSNFESVNAFAAQEMLWTPSGLYLLLRGTTGNLFGVLNQSVFTDLSSLLPSSFTVPDVNGIIVNRFGYLLAWTGTRLFLAGQGTSNSIALLAYTPSSNQIADYSSLYSGFTGTPCSLAYSNGDLYLSGFTGSVYPILTALNSSLNVIDLTPLVPASFGAIDTLAINGGNIFISGGIFNSIQYGLLTPPIVRHITFTEIGLPSGTSWNVTFNGTTSSNSSTTITFTVTKNGSYPYTVGNVPGYTASPSAGSVTVNGTDVNQQITFISTIPEFQPSMLLPLFMIMTLIGAIILKKKRRLALVHGAS
jgi:hypothetical protein